MKLKDFKYFAYKIGKKHIDMNFREFDSQKFDGINERPIEFRFLFDCLLKMQISEILDVGTGLSPLPSLLHNCGYLVTAIDNFSDYYDCYVYNRHWHVINDNITKSKLNKKFDLITCISVLEHIPVHEQAVAGMANLINSGGYLILTFPYNKNKYIENAYKLPDASYGQDLNYICQVFSKNELDLWCQHNNLEIVSQEYWKVYEGDFWTIGKPLTTPIQVEESDSHNLSCILLKKK